MPLVPAWGLGAPEVDRMLGQEGLAVGGVHEIKPVLTAGGLHAADRAAALLFALLLARRRLDGLARLPAAAGPSSILWCARQSDLKEFGRLHMPGLAALGIASEGFVFVETSSREDTLWAIEQGMMSGALAMVVGLVDDVGLTPARRLSLVAERTATPCLLLTPPRSMPVASVATRWRLGRARAGPHPFDPRAPGAARLAITLERCLSRPLAAAAPAFTLEWSDETHRFHMAAGVADRADAPVASRGIASRRVA